jgi:hypothetical protein
LETPKQPLSVKELKVPRVTNPHKIQVCDELERWRERENRDEINNELDRLHLTPRVLQTIEGDAISGVRGELNALVWGLASQEFMERAKVNEERECEGYIRDPPKAGRRWEKLTENRLNRLNRFPPGGFRFTEGLSRRLDRPQIRLSQAKIRLNRFSKNLHATFSDRID